MTEAKCVYCGACLPAAEELPGHRDGVVGRVFTCRVCVRCGRAHYEPVVSREELVGLYASGYGMRSGPLVQRLKRALLRERLSFALSCGRVEAVLDYGAGDGAFVSLANAIGLRAVGYDPFQEADSASPVARDRAAIMRCEDDLWQGDARLSLFTFWHTLEHLPEPAKVLARCAARATPQARLIIEAPDATSPEAILLGPHWCHWDPPFHLWHWDTERLAFLLSGTPWRPAEMVRSSWRRPLWFLSYTWEGARSLRRMVRGTEEPASVCVGDLLRALWSLRLKHLAQGPLLRAVCVLR